MEINPGFQIVREATTALPRGGAINFGR